MVYIEGYTSRNVIIKLLSRYNELNTKDTRLQEVRSPSIKNHDGIGNSQLNKIMIDQAISKMPEKVRVCVVNRWIKELYVQDTRETLEITTDEYYQYCSEGIDIIYRHFNKDRAGVKNLLNKIFKE